MKTQQNLILYDEDIYGLEPFGVNQVLEPLVLDAFNDDVYRGKNNDLLYVPTKKVNLIVRCMYD